MNKQTEQLSETYPAKCKLTGKCYERAYFLVKPGKSKKCDMNCNYIKKAVEKAEAENDIENNETQDRIGS